MLPRHDHRTIIAQQQCKERPAQRCDNHLPFAASAADDAVNAFGDAARGWRCVDLDLEAERPRCFAACFLARPPLPSRRPARVPEVMRSVSRCARLLTDTGRPSATAGACPADGSSGGRKLVSLAAPAVALAVAVITDVSGPL